MRSNTTARSRRWSKSLLSPKTGRCGGSAFVTTESVSRPNIQSRSLASSGACTGAINTRGLGWVWLYASGLYIGTAEESGWNPKEKGRGQYSASRSPDQSRADDENARAIRILIAEDNG